jgi:hypothetical protein
MGIADISYAKIIRQISIKRGLFIGGVLLVFLLKTD